jgi:hypothetical protein
MASYTSPQEDYRGEVRIDAAKGWSRPQWTAALLLYPVSARRPYTTRRRDIARPLLVHRIPTSPV